MTAEQSLRIADALGYEEAFLALLPTYYDIKKVREKELQKYQPKDTRVRKLSENIEE